MTTSIAPPYLLFIGDVRNHLDAKTASGLKQWSGDKCVGQWRLDEATVDLGLEDLMPKAALAAGARTLVIGISPVGGALPAAWIDALVEAIEAGLDIASGLHDRLSDNPRLRAAADANGRALHDIRHDLPPKRIATGMPRSGRRLLTVGTDCASGKKYTALAIHAALRSKGRAATFRATGQTGIMISGGGIPLDAVIADFAAGAVEQLCPAADPGHWDIVEGQGSLFHPAYAGVSMALLHGSQPDALVLCHQAGRTAIDGFEAFALPSLKECIARNEEAARLTNSAARCIAVSLDTSRLEPDARKTALAKAEEQTGLPAVDPLHTGVARVIDQLAQIGAPASPGPRPIASPNGRHGR
jgi:uncharacterized NAD-dependent epimerase/dehydratase family protein